MTHAFEEVKCVFFKCIYEHAGITHRSKSQPSEIHALMGRRITSQD